MATNAWYILLVKYNCICRCIQSPLFFPSPYRSNFSFSLLSFLPQKDLHLLFLYSFSLLSSSLRALPESLKLLPLVLVINIIWSDGCGDSLLWGTCFCVFHYLCSYFPSVSRQRGKEELAFLQLHDSQICFSFRCYLGDSMEA